MPYRICHTNAADGLAGMTSDEDNYEESKTMEQNMLKMREAFDTKARLGIEAIDAYDKLAWFDLRALPASKQRKHMTS